MANIWFQSELDRLIAPQRWGTAADLNLLASVVPDTWTDTQSCCDLLVTAGLWGADLEQATLRGHLQSCAQWSLILSDGHGRYMRVVPQEVRTSFFTRVKSNRAARKRQKEKQ